MRIRRRQSGFAIIAAVFLLVVLAGMVAYMMSIAAAQRQTVNLALQSARVLAAAKAGLEWGIYRRAGPPPDQAAGVMPTSNVCSGSLVVDGIDVKIECVVRSVMDGGAPADVVEITAVAVSGNPGSPDYVRRALTTSLLVDP